MAEWMQVIQPENMFEVIEVLLGKGTDLSLNSLSKANFDIVLLIATKLFSHPYWPIKFAETGILRTRAMEAIELALGSNQAVSGKFI